MIDFNAVKQKPWYRFYPETIQKALADHYKIPKIPLDQLLASSARYYPDTTAIVYEPADFIISYAEFYTLCRSFAAGLIHRFNLEQGERVAIFSRNYPEFLIAMYGILMAGGVYVACNPILTKEEVVYQLADSESVLAIISDDAQPMFKEIIAEKRLSLREVIVFDQDEGLKPSYLKKRKKPEQTFFYPFMAVFSDEAFEKCAIDPEVDLAAIIYTAGTTGVPKGVMVSHSNAVSSCILYYCTYTGTFPELDAEGFLVLKNHQQDLSAEWEFPIRYGIDSAIAAAPWTHMMGFIAHLHCSVMAAITIFPVPIFKVDKVLEMIRRWKISFAGGAPQMMSMILSRPDIDVQDLSSIRVWTTGGAPCPVAVGSEFEKRISGAVAEGYSLTEATMSSTKSFSNRSALRKWGSIGIPLPFTDVRIVDLETGEQEMPIDVDGELIHNGPQVAMGYLNKPEETAAMLRNGWLYTGDIARMDADGFFHITGRKKDIIIYKGYNIAPRMLEEVIYTHPAVYECAVVGQKDDFSGEIPVAFVTLREDFQATPDEIMAYVNENVAGYKKIRKVIIIDRLPVSGFGKVLRNELTKLL
ncbi:AMP-binding protein [Desulfosarcina sp. OttesenSCG-928-A07]|nr:AMP-binding protein [Desulfosarcina sp. OttesenSCG-928-G17]MDL2328968.1 AMP-binding protein [Desulfosarcina sp. OttesenSCG-928-A07]